MSKRFFLYSVPWLLFAVVLVVCCYIKFNWNHPKWVIEETIHDFGVMYPGEIREWICNLKNLNDAPVQISGIDTGCGCITTLYPTEPVHSGQTGQITFQFKVSDIPLPLRKVSRRPAKLILHAK
jgi:hypothetical protein